MSDLPLATLLAWLRTPKHGALSTLVDGAPFGTVVPYALDDAGRPLLFLSDLAVHTKALRADPRCSLLVTDPAASDPQQSWRVTLVGAARIDDAAQPAYLARHPDTQVLPGFHTWALDVTRVRFIEGFGRMGWRDGLA